MNAPAGTGLLVEPEPLGDGGPEPEGWSEELEAEWRAYVGLDGPRDDSDADLDATTRDRLRRVSSALQDVGVPEPMARAMTDVLRAGIPGATEAAPDRVFVASGVQARRAACWYEARQIVSLRHDARRAGWDLLRRDGHRSPDELDATQYEAWRADVKRVCAAELAAGTGWGIQECHDRVGVALALPEATQPALEALAAGWADWRRVRAWWRACADMTTEQARQVADGVFSASSTTDGEGEPVLTSWAEFHRLLQREVTRIQGSQAAGARARRKQSLAHRDAVATLNDDGTGALTITGSASAVVGAFGRLDAVARASRAAGDPRPLHQIRSDTAFAVLCHGTVEDDALDEAAARAHEGGADDADEHRLDLHGPLVPLARRVRDLLTGRGPTAMEVIVPLGSLLGATPHRCDGGGRATGGRPEADPPTWPDCATDPGEECAHPPWDPCAHDPAPEPVSDSGVAEIPGHGFITAEHARELLAAEGTTLHRLLTDPADGRLVERSTTSYRPDRAMTAQVVAADRTCTGPGCTVPARSCERDHEIPWPAGPTSEANLNLKHGLHHWLKSAGHWTSAMDATRHVTWHTVLGRVYRVRPHDYRQYGSAPPPQPPPPELVDRAVREDPALGDHLIYAALASRPYQVEEDRLAAGDDYPTTDPLDWLDWHATTAEVRLRHRRGTGYWSGPPRNQLSPHGLLRKATGHDLDHTPPPF